MYCLSYNYTVANYYNSPLDWVMDTIVKQTIHGNGLGCGKGSYYGSYAYCFGLGYGHCTYCQHLILRLP